LIYQANGLINKEVKVGSLKGSSKIMNAVVGETFTTQKSGVSGVVKEIIKNANGTSRVLLEVNGADRWTTVK
jgi:hypothetical protein